MEKLQLHQMATIVLTFVIRFAKVVLYAKTIIVYIEGSTDASINCSTSAYIKLLCKKTFC